MWQLRRALSAICKFGTFLATLSLPLALQPLAAESPAVAVPDFPLITNLFQLRHAVSGNMGAIAPFALEGTVLAADADSGTIFLKDGSGAEVLETTLTGQSLQPGQIIQLAGTNYLAATEIGISLGKSPVVENDGMHSKSEGTATVFLRTGRLPIRVLWFNNLGDRFLETFYSSPGFNRQKIPDSALFRSQGLANGPGYFTNGLDYRCYEGKWIKLPRFRNLIPVKTGVTSNFNLDVKTRNECVGLAFDGFIQVDRDGPYTFYVVSDDGAQLFLYDSAVQLKVLGAGDPPVPDEFLVKQPVPIDRGPFWSQVEGKVTFVGRQPNHRAELELTANDAHMRVIVANAADEMPSFLLNSQVKLSGICLDAANDASHALADTLVIPDWRSLHVLESDSDFWSAAKALTASDCLTNEPIQDKPQVVRVGGTLHSTVPGQLAVLADETGSLPVELLNPSPSPALGPVECLGLLVQTGSNRVLRDAIWRPVAKPQPARTTLAALPTLTTAAEVQQLNRESAQRGYPVKLTGVVTWVSENRDCVVLQDATRGVFVGLRAAWTLDAPKAGDILEIEGNCVPAEFSPIVILSHGQRLGRGLLPAPIRPTREQLVGGSLDDQYIEINGLATASQDENHLTLLMPGGKTEIEFYPPPATPVASLINSVVRIRGVMFANWDLATHMVTPNRPLRFGSALICADVLPPLDPFNADRMRARELMQFDVRRNTFQRVKVLGQCLCNRAGTCFMTDDGFGFRFEPVKPVNFEAGDMLDVVGLVELGAASPVLREAIARKISRLELPSPEPLAFDETNSIRDCSRVWAIGLLLGIKDAGSERVLEMQSGLNHFAARLPASSRAIDSWPVGSRLKLTGIVSHLGTRPPSGQSLNSFELLLNSPADVDLLARPPWWTLDRLLMIVAVLTLGLALAFIWISLLRAQVERRSLQLQREISERQRAEQERAIEKERSRIALDLHDDLGSRLTAISMLATTGQGPKPSAEASRERLQLIADKSRLMVTTLDGLVWAVDPKNDTVTSLAEYLASFTEEFLARTGIAFHVELPQSFPDRTVAAEARHNVLLAVREALNNAVRHGRPAEIHLQLTCSNTDLAIVLRDNGGGFDPRKVTPGNGLDNLHARLRKVNGHCHIESSPGHGTTVVLNLPF